jgi:carboxylesterase type B
LAAPSENEDCLVLNIFTPLNDNKTALPVMLFLHGGGFGVGSGSSSFYGPQFLVAHDVIVVTINYRLNVFGFLNLGIRKAPGNAGLKDIRAALRWIKDNIKNFNGDPNNVTVFGQGSGGTAALYLMLSESTKGLFHKVISESGTFFSPESFDKDPLATASQTAKSLGVNSRNPDTLLKVYTENSIAKIEEAISKQMHAKSVFVPSVEELFDDEEAFLTDTPYNILSKSYNHKCFNPVPLIIGLNTVEGLISTLDYYTITSQMDRLRNEDYRVLDQRSLNISREDIEDYRKSLNMSYFSNLDSEEDLLGGFINLNTDFSYVGPLTLFGEMYANNSGQPMFNYIFNYTGSRNLGSLLTNSSLSATTNRDELFYLFEMERLPLPMDERDARMITFMTLMWTNFAKFG